MLCGCWRAPDADTSRSLPASHRHDQEQSAYPAPLLKHGPVSSLDLYRGYRGSDFHAAHLFPARQQFIFGVIRRAPAELLE